MTVRIWQQISSENLFEWFSSAVEEILLTPKFPILDISPLKLCTSSDVEDIISTSTEIDELLESETKLARIRLLLLDKRLNCNGFLSIPKKKRFYTKKVFILNFTIGITLFLDTYKKISSHYKTFIISL